MPIGTTSEGGALFGRGRLTDPEETRAFWASGFSQADQFQRKVTELARLYDTDMVTAYHLAMGTLSNNFAQHLADAGLRATDYSKLSAPKMRAFDSLMRNGYVDPVTGKQIDFPNWPGLAFPEEAAQVMKEDPLLRKWYNNRMKTPKVTEALDLPNAKSIEYAMTEPDIRNMEINLTGLSAGRMKPGAELRPDSAHNTYSHDILGTAVGRAPELAPFSISFPDVTSFVREQYRPQDFTGTIQKVFPHQVVDEAYLEDMQKYYEQLRKVRGYKEGGAVSFSDDPDTMRLELAGGGLVKSAAKVAGKGLFSAVDRTAQNLKRPAGTGKEFMAEIKASPGIKATELKGRKLAEIEALPKMTKDQFIKELEARPPVKIEEKVLGQPSQKEIDELADKLAYDKSVESARYYGERGDDIDALAEENYLFNIRNNLEEFREEARQSLIDEGQGGPFHENKFTIPGGKNYREILLKAPAAKGEGFLGTPAHFGGEPNILASIRVSDRTGPNGEKILHVEEIQSDWHQAGRKKGYKEEYKSRFGDIDGQQMKVSDLIAQQGDAGIKWIEGKNSVNRDLDLPELAGDDLINVVTENGAPVLIKEARFSDITKMVDSHRRGVADLEAQERQLFNKSQQEKLPDAPFKKDWQELALRRVMQEAAEGGYDRVALTKGAEQADRYDLSKQVGRITYTPDINGGTLKATDLGNQNYIITETNVTPDRLEALIGKEAAQKLVDAPLEGGSQTLSGEGLKVGGEGMEGFYDKMLPDYLNKLGKQYGVEVSPVTITHPKNSGTTYNAIPPLTSTDFHGFEVTPQMRQDITEKGLPLYQQIGIPVGAGTAGTGTATIAPEGLGTNDEQQVQNPVNFTENPDAMLLEMMQRN
jgi:hypothetical protein